MQATTSSFNWGRVVMILRWVARVVGAVAALGLLLMVGIATGGGGGVSPPGTEPAMWALWTIEGAGLLLAIGGSIHWKFISPGIGEVVGGLLLVAGGVWQSLLFLPPQTGQIAGGALFYGTGVLFIICGWYALAHRRSSQANVAHTAI
ncbi:MAG TPA: hypothetical protein VFU88_19725 [Ktedonobacterales bacterium]|nr:hypothetical protein [Ktedonobacterales bacterium]